MPFGRLRECQLILMDKIFGLPAHPLLVHIPVVLLPLAAIGVVAMAIRPAWHARYRWIVLGLGAVGAIGAVLAASAGEELERRIVAVEGPDAAATWARHAELGDTARTTALIFFVIIAAYVFVPWWLERRKSTHGPLTGTGTVGAAAYVDDRPRPDRNPVRALRIAVTVLALLGAAATVRSVVLAGHTGSQSVWQDYVKKTGAGG